MKIKMTGPRAFLPLAIVLSVAGFQSTAYAASVGLKVNANQTQSSIICILLGLAS